MQGAIKRKGSGLILVIVKFFPKCMDVGCLFSESP